MTKPGYSEQDGYVVVTMTPADFRQVVLALGIMGGVLGVDEGSEAYAAAIALANRLNEGNPHWAPYSGTLTE